MLSKLYILLFLVIFVFGCQRESPNLDITKLKFPPKNILESWSNKKWVFLTTNCKYLESDKYLYMFDVLSDHDISLEITNGFFTSVASEAELGILAYAQWENSPNSNPGSSIILKTSMSSVVLFKAKLGIHGLTWSPNGKQLAFFLGNGSNGWDNQEMCVLDVGSKVVTKYGKIDCWKPDQIIHNPQLLGFQLTWSSQSDELFYATKEKYLKKVDLITGKHYEIGKGCIPVLEKGKKLYFLLDKPFSIRELDLASGKVDNIFTAKNIPAFGKTVISPDMEYIAVNVLPSGVKSPEIETFIFGFKEGPLGVIPKKVLGWTRKVQDGASRKRESR